MKKLLKWGLIAIVAIIVIGAISGGGKSENSGQQNTGSEQTANSETKEVVQLAKVGETVTDKDLAFTVTSIDKASSLGNQYMNKDAQGEFYVVTLKIENVGKETKTVDSSMLQVTDSQDRKFDRSIDGQTAKGLSEGQVDLFLQQVQPGLSVTGTAVFDLPKDVQEPKLLVKGSMFSSGREISLVTE